MTPYPKYPYVQGIALEDYFAGLDRYEAEVAAWVHAAPPCIGFRFDNGILRIVTPGFPHDDSPWRVSTFNSKGEAWGHTCFSSKTEAIKDAALGADAVVTE
jgi:hypothetical protein